MLKVNTGSVKIIKNNAEVSVNVLAAVHNVQVQHEISTPGMFSFSFNSMSPTGQWQGVDLDSFKPGDDIEIYMGLNQLDKLITGKITAVEPSFKALASATIRGFDYMYQLKFGTRTESFELQGYSALMEKVATSAKLTAQIEGEPGELNDSLLQNGISNFDFLSQRIEEINYEMLMQQTTLLIRPCAAGLSPVQTLEFPKNISEVELNLKVPTMGDKVTVTGWNLEANEVISAVVSSATLQQKMGGQESGQQVSNSFPESAIALERPDISSPEALEVIAKAEYQRNLNRFLQGSGSLVGNARIIAGVNIKLEGLSDRFDGIYYVTSSTHSYDVITGYKTDIQIRRTGI